MRANEKVADGAKDAKHSNMDRVVRGGVYGEGEGVETVVLEWGRGIFSGNPLDIFVEFVFHGEPGWVPDAAHTKHECDRPGGDGGRVTYPIRLLVGSVCGVEDKAGLEALKSMGK